MFTPQRVHRDLYASGPRPRLEWHCTQGRLELSGHVLATWTSKIGNLLLEECDAGPGTRVLLDTPEHWRSATWALGAWVTGALVVLPAPGATPVSGTPAADVVATTRPEAWDRAAAPEVVVAVSTESFALRWPDPLPPGVLDGGIDVAGYADDLQPVAVVPLDTPAVEHPGGSLSVRDLTRTTADALPALLGWWPALAAGDLVVLREGGS
ncbi:TIGR03089 family protein [Serinibacter salmoneus]|uniref:Uncharacterized protein (TIGR03089 family) n=1 Tax=Serinibacter salmoneus TaxID=556530 RepID=A0A2A9D3D8_9MICO|nr:TIGR03089 family protein [Serinibacter salmoneus]PFG20349.1 uncharacterized protein (TIGR03089 family) [Serinibacter salmoneus]